MKFRHAVIDPEPPGAQHDITLLFDVNGNGKKDIVIGAKIGGKPFHPEIHIDVWFNE